MRPEGEQAMSLKWLGVRYRMQRSGFAFTDHDQRMLRAIGRYLSARHQLAHQASDDPGILRLFGGRAEDHVVSAWLDQAASGDAPTRSNAERIDDAVEVLRACALGTYENRRITMGALLFGGQPDPCHERPSDHTDAIRYARLLTGIRSFRRLSDGLQTVALVDEMGMLVEILDVHEWALPFADEPLPVPAASAYATHARATLCGGHLCLVLTPNGEIKAFSGGVQVFNFLDGVWRLGNAAEKQRVWRHALGEHPLADRLFSVALDLAEDRRGGLFLVVHDPAQIDRLVAAPDLLGTPTIVGSERAPALKRDLHYLLRQKNCPRSRTECARDAGPHRRGRGPGLQREPARLRRHRAPSARRRRTRGHRGGPQHRGRHRLACRQGPQDQRGRPGLVLRGGSLRVGAMTIAVLGAPDRQRHLSAPVLLPSL